MTFDSTRRGKPASKPRAEQSSASITGSNLQYNTKDPIKHKSSRANPGRFQADHGSVLPQSIQRAQHAMKAPSGSSSSPRIARSNKQQVSSATVLPGSKASGSAQPARQGGIARRNKIGQSTTTKTKADNITRHNRNQESSATVTKADNIRRNNRNNESSDGGVTSATGVKRDVRQYAASGSEKTFQAQGLARSSGRNQQSSQESSGGTGIRRSAAQNKQTASTPSFMADTISRKNRNVQSTGQSVTSFSGKGGRNNDLQKSSFNILGGGGDAAPASKPSTARRTAPSSGAGKTSSNPMRTQGRNAQSAQASYKAPIQVRQNRNVSQFTLG